MSQINDMHIEHAKKWGICLKSGRSISEHLFSVEINKSENDFEIKYGFDGDVDTKFYFEGESFLTKEEIIDLSEQMITKWQKVIMLTKAKQTEEK